MSDNYCIVCGQSIGSSNPRQFCRKTYCENERIIKVDRELREKYQDKMEKYREFKMVKEKLDEGSPFIFKILRHNIMKKNQDCNEVLYKILCDYCDIVEKYPDFIKKDKIERLDNDLKDFEEYNKA